MRPLDIRQKRLYLPISHVEKRVLGTFVSEYRRSMLTGSYALGVEAFRCVGIRSRRLLPIRQARKRESGSRMAIAGFVETNLQALGACSRDRRH